MTGSAGTDRVGTVAGAVVALAAFVALTSVEAADFKSPKLRNEGFERGFTEWEGAGAGWRIADGAVTV